MFSLFETSRHLGEPVFLYFVKYGSGVDDTYAFSDGEADVTVGHTTYKKSQIKLDDNIVASGSLDKKQIKIRTPRTSPLTELFRVYPPDEQVTLRISSGHQDDPDKEFISIWHGRILGFNLEGSEAVFDCEPIGTSLRRPGLRRCWTYGCPHVLYGPHCRADKASATVLSSVSAVAGSIITLPDSWFGGLDPLVFINGTLEWKKPSGAEISRTILDIDSASGPHRDLLLSGRPTDLAAGASVAVVKGCDHKMSGCYDHDNILNFGGFPWIPTGNPIGNRNNFY